MFAKHVLPVLVAVGFATAQSTNVCSQSTATVNSAADATALSTCTTISGSVLIGPSTGNTIDLSGPQSIKGDLICGDNGGLITLSSSSLRSIAGDFKLNNLTLMSTLSMPSLTSVGSITWNSLNALSQLTFTSRVTKANKVVISDTFLSTLQGIDLTSVPNGMDINNNRYLTSFNTQIGNLSGNLNIQANGLNLKVELPNLIWIANMTISNVSSFLVPSLAVVNGSARFDSNYFTSFVAPNLTSTTDGDISFVSNAGLANISMPLLKSVGGGLTIANNTDLGKINGFPTLQSIGGAVLLRGNFSDFEFPKLNDVKGAFDVSSTTDLTASCKNFAPLAPTTQNGNGEIQGTYTCTSNNSQANSDTGNGNGTSGGGSGGGSSGSKNGAAGLSTSAFTVLILAALGGFASLL